MWLIKLDACTSCKRYKCQWVPVCRLDSNFSYLQYIPTYENAIILGANWLSSEWNPSKQLVWAKGDACLIPFIRLLLVKAVQSLSYATESNTKQHEQNNKKGKYFYFP